MKRRAHVLTGDDDDDDDDAAALMSKKTVRALVGYCVHIMHLSYRWQLLACLWSSVVSKQNAHTSLTLHMHYQQIDHRM